MKKAILVLSVFILSTIIVSYSSSIQLKASPAAPEAATPIDPVFPGLGVITSRTMEDGRMATSHQGIFGPDSCTHMGDPYSPLNSDWAAGPYTYTYRIYIPPNYAHDVVRVELFDPDSINQAENNFIINRSNIAINNDLNSVDPKTCGTDGGSSDRVQPCLLNTEELGLVNGSPNLELDEVNPYWFVRIDENRRPPITPGGSCGVPESGMYTPSLNTQTRYTLSYYAQNINGVEKVPLVTYFGQVGDGIRDSGDHLTDMRWVSPGADVPFATVDDPGVSVPAVAQTTDSFEIDLTTDVPNIFVDQSTGARYLYLDVQAMSGASENGYEIWAGPPDYISTVPSEVNFRNLYLLNTPGSHDSQGVEVTAVNTLVQNSNFTNPLDIPLTYIGPEMTGQTINIRLFDSDSGTEPPIVFYFDTIAFTPDDTDASGYDPASTDWAMAFAVADQDDPDGVPEGVRCVPWLCDNQWIDPAYQITIPGDLSNCDWQNPTAEDCTPFYGGRLMVLYDGGFSETYTWELSSVLGNDPIDQTAGCTAFPIGINEAARSVTAPGTGSNPYPDGADFSYPSNPPIYASFLDHQEDVLLLNATPGDIFRVQNGFGSGNFGWLVWNTGIVPNAATSVNSLTWPGDTLDYTDHTDGGTAVPGSGFAHVVRGYIEPGDPTDHALHIGDWLAASTGSINSSAIRDAVNEHIDLERTLRLPIWNNSSGSQYQTAQFAIFRIIGYSITEDWLLLEFVDFDASCGQISIPVAPTSVAITGPTEGEPETSYSFTATVNPGTTTTPVAYTWEITDHDTTTSTGGISNTVMLDWSSEGSKTVTVTAVNSSGLSVSQSHIINVALPDDPASDKLLYLPVVVNTSD